MNLARIFPLTLATVLGIGSLCYHASAAALIRVTESGGNVVVSATGRLNTVGLTFASTSSSGQGIHPADSFLEVSSGTVDLYNSVSGPSSFGSGGFNFPSSGSGDRFGIRFGSASLVVPAGYVSGSPLSGTSTFSNSSFAQLGLLPGTYTWKWGSGANADSLTVKIVDVAIQIQASLIIDGNRNPLLRWQAEAGRRYSISYSTDLKSYVPIASGFPFGGATTSFLEFPDLPIFAPDTPKGFYKVERDPRVTQNSSDELTAFFNDNGGKAGFSPNQVQALETLLYGLDEIEAGQLVAARARVDAMLAAYPLSSSGWGTNYGYRGLNVGNPVGYYGIRMLDQILTLGNPSRAGKLRMTAVVAPTALVTRPTLPDLAPETLQLDIAPQILAEDARLLHLVTRLFRRWVQAITGGLQVELNVHVMDQGTTVKFTNYPGYITSYPNFQAMVQSVPASIASTTDLWWVIAPSGVPGDGSGFGKTFITGGQTSDYSGVPLIISDDGWFTRKPEHMGSGPYSEVELKMYHPQWFQHEFMHHIFETWPEFELEKSDHQWFYRDKWPSDFVGSIEPDYYIEAVNKRLLGATPSLADGLRMRVLADMSVFPIEKLVGSYKRTPVLNPWHEVNISLNNGNLRWTNAAGFSWGLEIIGKELWSTSESPYGAEKLPVLIDRNGNVLTISNSTDSYLRQEPASTALRTAKKLFREPVVCRECSFGHGPISLPTSKVAPTSPVQNRPDPAVLK